MNKQCSLRYRSSGFIRALRVDLHRAVLSRRFLLTVVLILAWLVVNSATNIFVYDFLYFYGIPYSFNQAMVGNDGLGMIVLAMATVPYSTSYLTDRASGFDHHAIKRVGFPTYVASRVVSVGVSAFLAMVAAAGIFLSCLCLSGAQQSIARDAEHLNGVYYELVLTVGPWCYYLVRFTISGLTAALASVFALYATTLVPNIYVALLSPLIGYYTWESVISLIFNLSGGRASFLSLFTMYNNITHQISTDNLFSFLWTTVYLLTLTVLCGRGFVIRTRKEQGL